LTGDGEVPVGHVPWLERSVAGETAFTVTRESASAAVFSEPFDVAQVSSELRNEV
jgi:hypothetical protein